MSDFPSSRNNISTRLQCNTNINCRWEGSIKHPVLGCYLTLPLYFFGINAGSLTTLVGKPAER